MRSLRTFIVNKQEGQFKKGDLSKYVDIAINYLLAGYSTHAHGTQNTNPYQIPKGRLKAKNLMQDICNQLIQSGLRIQVNPETTIPTKHLDQMIREVTGYHDKRTIRKHTEELIKYGYLEDKGYSGSLLIKDTGSEIEYLQRIMKQQRRGERNNEHQEISIDKIRIENSAKPTPTAGSIDKK